MCAQYAPGVPCSGDAAPPHSEVASRSGAREHQLHDADPLVRPRALVVDDDAAVRAILRDGLETAGVQVLEAADGASGLRMLVDHLLDLDLLVTDLQMPGLDGASLVRIVRAEGGERELAILVLSGALGSRDRELLGRLDIDALVEKRAGSDVAVRAAVRLATAARDRRVGLEAPAPKAVTLGALSLARVPRERTG